MMKIRVTSVTDLASRRARYFDLHEDFGLAYLSEQDDRTILYLNDRECRSWRHAEYPNLREVRWLEPDKVIGWFDEDLEAVIISAELWRKLTLGGPDNVFVSKSYIFAGNHIDTRGSRGPYIGEAVAAFTRDGDFVLGADEFLIKATQPDIYEITAGYILDDSFIFIAYSEEMIFRFEPARRELSYFPVNFPEPFSIVNANVFAGDDKEAWAIFDNRVLLRYNPERPAFEFALFDLASGNASKADFSLVEKELVIAGFNMSEIQFQPNSIGQTIVSDTTKAGLLEISDFP